MIAPRRFIVTGGSGFVGKHAVAALLANGHEVVALSRVNHSFPREVEIVANDLLHTQDFAAVVAHARAHTLLHLAWETRHGYFWNAPENLDWIAASVKLVRAFREAGGERVVIAGTCAEYANSSSGLCNAQTTPREPQHLYSVSKDCLYRAVEIYAAVSDLSFAWGRVFHLSGPGESEARLIPSAWHSLQAEKVFATGVGDKQLDMMDVRDCGRAFACLAASDFQGPINIASGEPRTIRSVLQELADLAGRRDLIGFGLRPESAGDISDRWAEITALRTELGFEPQFGLRETLRAATGCALDCR